MKFHTPLIFLLLLLFCKSGFAWDDKNTHQDLSKFAVKSSVLDTSKSNFLLIFGYSDGVDQALTGSEAANGAVSTNTHSVVDWVRAGAQHEDDGDIFDLTGPLVRYLNHFHNPLKSWNSAGLNDVSSGESSIVWAQDATKQNRAAGGDWSWATTRGYYYKCRHH